MKSKRPVIHPRFPNDLWILSLLLFLTSCSTLIGNVKPVEEKSTTYKILDLTQSNSDWVRVETTKEGNESAQTAISDEAFQSKATASIISISSACKKYETERKQSLTALTRELLLGVSHISLFEERNLVLASVPALETTVKGQINNEDMILRTIVFQKGKCVFDLMYVCRPDKFTLNEDVFSKFVSSFKMK